MAITTHRLGKMLYPGIKKYFEKAYGIEQSPIEVRYHESVGIYIWNGEFLTTAATATYQVMTKEHGWQHLTKELIEDSKVLGDLTDMLDKLEDLLKAGEI